MEYEYSNRMKRLMKKGPSITATFIFAVIVVALVVGLIYGLQKDKDSSKEQAENAVSFSPMVGEAVYSELAPLYLFEEFASNFNNSIYYCFAFDKDFRTYVVAISAEDRVKYSEHIEYTYSEDPELKAPEPIILKGMSVLIEKELLDLAVDAHNQIFSDEVITDSNYKFAFGSYYLDTTKSPEAASSNSIIYILLIGLSVIGYLVYLGMAQRTAGVTRMTLEKYSSKELSEVDRELRQSSTRSFTGQRLYLTENYIISGRQGFKIIPYDTVNQVYGSADKDEAVKNRYSVVVESKDGRRHDIAVIKSHANKSTEYDPIIAVLDQKLPDIPFGSEDEINTMKSSRLSIEVDEESSNGGRHSNVALGILGAVLGAILGGIIWIIIGKLGFIAGIAGYFMMLFAITGYRMLSGFLDKRGQIIAVVIALVMIFIANYTQYILEYIEYFYDNSYTLANISDAFRTLPDLLNIFDGWGDFFKDLAIGYFLSIWASLNILRSIFSKKEE